MDIQVANEYVYTGLSFTVPKNTLFIFTARADYNTSESVGISIAGSDLNHNISTIVVNSEKYPTVLTHVLDRVSEDITYYIWAKYKSKGNNRIVQPFQPPARVQIFVCILPFVKLTSKIAQVS